MKRHLIVLDLDGTTLTDKKTIDTPTVKAIHRLQREGHAVMIATGRPYRSSEPYYKELQLQTPIVNFNGAYIHHPLDNSYELSHTPLPMQVAHDIVEACHQFDFHNIIAEVIDDVYFHYHDERLLDIFTMGNPQMTTGDLRSYLTTDPTSMLIHAPESYVHGIRHHLSEAHAEVIDHRRWAAPWHVIEVVHAGIHKAVGIRKVAKELDIPSSRIISFGDEDNDLEMLEYAGIGVAMGNATPEVKQVANEVTLTNEQNGVAAFLNDYFFSSTHPL